MTVVGGRENLNGCQSMQGLGLSPKWKQPDSSIPLASWGLSSAEVAHFRVKTPKPPFGEARRVKVIVTIKESAVAIRLALPTTCRSSRQT